MQSFKCGSIVLWVAAGWISASWAAPDPAQELALPANVAASMRGIDAERIRAHVKFLSDDLLEGRGTGSRGGDIAANTSPRNLRWTD